jgi:hypothetical protein
MGVVLDCCVTFHSVVHLYCCQHAARTYGVCSMPILTFTETSVGTGAGKVVFLFSSKERGEDNHDGLESGLRERKSESHIHHFGPSL